MTIKHMVVSMAGLGSRLGKGCPKGLIDIGEHKLVWYLLQLTKEISDVRFVVGYKSQDVIDYVRSIREDAKFILNSKYETTSCAYSIRMGTEDIKDAYLIVDGDLLLDSKSFDFFKSKCKDDTIVGITPAKTEEGVFVEMDETKGTILSFTRKPVSCWEWSGVAYINGFLINPQLQFICDTLANKLPLKYLPINCFEIDTPSDYQLALNNVSRLGYEM